MKILHVNKFFDLHGGAETYVHALMRHQQAAGHEVHAFSTRAAKNVSSPDSHLFVERYDYSRRETIAKDGVKALAYIWNREARRGMQAALSEFQPDVVHLHNIYHHLSTSILGPIRSAGIPCVQTLHDYKLACPNYKMFTEGAPCERCKGGQYTQAVKHHCLSSGSAENILAAVEMGYTKLTQAYERTVRSFLCPSQFMADKMKAWGEPPSKFVVVRNPIDVSEIQSEQDGDYILYAGRLSAEKGIETLVQAASRVPMVKLHIAGIGPEEARLRGLVETMHLSNIVFRGFLRSQDLAEERRHAIALVVPSIWYENAPYAVLEAMGEGLPIIASRIGGLPELVHDRETGWLVDPGNVHAWTEALRICIETSHDERREMGARGRDLVSRQHAWLEHLSRLESVYTASHKHL